MGEWEARQGLNVFISRGVGEEPALRCSADAAFGSLAR